MLASYFGIKPRTKTTETPETKNDEMGKILSEFPQDPMTLPKGDLTIGSGHKKEIGNE